MCLRIPRPDHTEPTEFGKNGRMSRQRDPETEQQHGASVAAVLRAATAAYLDGKPIDMSALAAELELSRATLYRRVGNHDQLVGLVLAELSERMFHEVKVGVHSSGAARILDGFERFINAVVAAAPLRELIHRDPLLFIRVVLAPGVVEDRMTTLLTGLLDEEVDAGTLRLRLPTPVLAKAMVRIADSFMYSHLLGGGEPEMPQAVMIVTLMLESVTEPVASDLPG